MTQILCEYVSYTDIQIRVCIVYCTYRVCTVHMQIILYHAGQNFSFHTCNTFCEPPPPSPPPPPPFALSLTGRILHSDAALYPDGAQGILDIVEINVAFQEKVQGLGSRSGFTLGFRV